MTTDALAEAQFDLVEPVKSMTSSSSDTDLVVVCALNRRSQLPDHQQHRAQGDSVSALTVGSEYIVLGMLLFENVLNFLVRDDTDDPFFFPAGMFELVTSPLPEHWGFSLRSGIRASGTDLWVHPIQAVWGYPELVNDPDHINQLGELETEALDIFTAHFLAARARREGNAPD